MSLPSLHLKPSEHVKRVVRDATGPITHNVVVTACDTHVLQTGTIPIDEIAAQSLGRRKKRGFASSIVYHLRDEGYSCTISVFQRAKFVVVGAPSEQAAVLALWRLVQHIAETTGHHYLVQQFKVINIQSTVDIGWTLDLDKIHSYLPEASYDTTVIQHIKINLNADARATCLVYDTGNLVLTGASSYEQLVRAKNVLVPFLAHFTLRKKT